MASGISGSIPIVSLPSWRNGNHSNPNPLNVNPFFALVPLEFPQMVEILWKSWTEPWVQPGNSPCIHPGAGVAWGALRRQPTASTSPQKLCWVPAGGRVRRLSPSSPFPKPRPLYPMGVCGMTGDRPGEFPTDHTGQKSGETLA